MPSRIRLLLLLFVLPTLVEAARADEAAFNKDIKPLLNRYCIRCHNGDEMKAGIRLDRLTGQFEDRHLRLWEAVQSQIAEEIMPPEDERQPSGAERERIAEWIGVELQAARLRKRPNNGSIRRLTVAQYRNSLRDLLGLEQDYTDILPPDGVSKDGFVNHGKTLLLSPLLMESYFDIAEKALRASIVDPNKKPVVQQFRMDLGKRVNGAPCPDKLILGANSHLLANDDFVVRELQPPKPFEYTPFKMQTHYRFIEGYQGNATVRGWREFDSIYHAVFACMRGTPGYPKGLAFETAADGLLLRPAIPSSELFGQSSTYGPKANFKVSLRELPHTGRFRVTVRAARYNDALLLDASEPLAVDDATLFWSAADENASDQDIRVERAGVYQVDVYAMKGAKPGVLTLEFGRRRFSSQLNPKNAAAKKKAESSEQEQNETHLRGNAFMLVRLAAGPQRLAHTATDGVQVRRIALHRLDDESPAAKRFQTFERRRPYLGVHVGLRRDCGSTLTQVGQVQPIDRENAGEYVFEGAIENYPSPDVEENNVNYLAGVREIGVRSEYSDGRDLPRLVIQSVEFEGPLYETWPPKSHQRIFIDSPSGAKHDSPAYAREVVLSFAERAFRRPLAKHEQASLMKVWRDSHKEHGDFQAAVKDALLVVLTSPQFLFMIEKSDSADDEDLSDWELATKLAYFLWNSPPDSRLLELAKAGELRKSLNSEFDRMVDDPRFNDFLTPFAEQWLSLDKLDVVEIDRKRYPMLTRTARRHLRREPIETLRRMLDNNLPLRELLRSDVVVANDVVASYYGLGEASENGFEFRPLTHGGDHLGGLLSQAGILAGLSDGRESNPVKRGAWLARKIIAKPPADPPPNVPELEEDENAKLTLRERLERHRNQEGCKKCHSGIDPWGVPFEEFDAAGLLKRADVDARSTLPDETEIADLNALKAHLAGEMLDQVAFSFLKHLTTYATGRTLGYREIELLKEKGLQLKSDGYRTKDMLRFVVNSDSFLKK